MKLSITLLQTTYNLALAQLEEVNCVWKYKFMEIK